MGITHYINYSKSHKESWTVCKMDGESLTDSRRPPHKGTQPLSHEYGPCWIAPINRNEKRCNIKAAMPDVPYRARFWRPTEPSDASISHQETVSVTFEKEELPPFILISVAVSRAAIRHNVLDRCLFFLSCFLISLSLGHFCALTSRVPPKSRTRRSPLYNPIDSQFTQ